MSISCPFSAVFIGLLLSFQVPAQESAISMAIDNREINPATLMWYDTAAGAWEEALPVGNGRLGAMVFGKPGEERIQLNEETYWSGGPYSTVVKGGAEALPGIQEALFEGKPIEAHRIFGHHCKCLGPPQRCTVRPRRVDWIGYYSNRRDTVRLGR